MVVTGQSNSPFPWIAGRQWNQGIALDRTFFLATCGSVCQAGLALPSMICEILLMIWDAERTNVLKSWPYQGSFLMDVVPSWSWLILCARYNTARKYRKRRPHNNEQGLSNLNNIKRDTDALDVRPRCVIVRALLWHPVRVCNKTDRLTIWSPCHAQLWNLQIPWLFALRIEGECKKNRRVQHARDVDRCVRGRRVRRWCKCIFFCKAFVIQCCVDLDKSTDGGLKYKKRQWDSHLNWST